MLVFRYRAGSPVAFVALMLLLVVLASGCEQTKSGSQSSDSETPSSPVLLISLDGFRWDYLDRYEAPHLKQLAEVGVRADALIPVFPTETFPNHYTQVTGLYPVHHGIISNTMYDPEFDATFSLSNEKAIRSARWWEGEPIWVTAEKQGKTAATYFWPGSEAPIQGERPTHWVPYDGSVPGSKRVDQVLSWLTLPEAERPDFLTLYFSAVDHAGHVHGPDSPEVAEAIRQVDRHLGRLIAGLKEHALYDRINLLVVSDHGMAATSPERAIVLDDYIDLGDVRVVDYSPVLMMRPKSGKADSVYEALRGAHPHLSLYRRGELPDTLHFSGHRRIPPLVGLADEGWSITTRRRLANNRARLEGGTHGYPPSVRSMHGLFIAHGPSFRERATVPAFSSVHLYALMAALLNVTPAPHDGSLEAVRAVLHPDVSQHASEEL